MYQTLLSAGNGQAFDPINTPGYWHNNPAYASVHTQSPHDGSDGLVTGGMDDRFDFQLVSGELMDNEGVSYIPGSYHAFGNNGTSYNQAVNYFANTYPVSDAVLDALAHASDHLPVVADYQLPAKMHVQAGTIPERVLVGASVNIPLTVTNVAPVSFSNGADELDYLVTGTGDVFGFASGAADPLATGNAHNLVLDTSAAKLASGSLAVNSDSQNVANGAFLRAYQADVLDHAEASFSASQDIDLLTIDFGTLATNSGVIEQPFSIHNIEQTAGYTAGLDLDSFDTSGDIATLATDLSTFLGLIAGGSNAFTASLDTSVAGSFSSTYTLYVGDEDLPGALSGNNLTIHLLANVVAVLDGDLNADGFVGVDDLNIVLTHWNQNVTPGDLTMGDPTGEGFVGVDDLNVVLTNWNNGVPTAENTQIPEPGTLSLLLLAGSALLNRENRRLPL